MSKILYTSPSYEESAFNCPHCHVYANQSWAEIKVSGDCSHGVKKGQFGELKAQMSLIKKNNDLNLRICDHCDEFTFWFQKQMVFPLTSTAPFPNADLPDDIKQYYEEARQIQSLSPRGSAALLRLCIQQLCEYLGGKGENINQDIPLLVSKGLPEKVQQALDIVRVVGNKAVHPGQIYLKDDADITNNLFILVNLICEVMITQPQYVKELYNKVVPDTQRAAIEIEINHNKSNAHGTLSLRYSAQ